MVTLVISFEYVTGRHTALNIKKQYDIILGLFGLTDKVYKVVAANMKKALEKEKESISIPVGASTRKILR